MLATELEGTAPFTAPPSLSAPTELPATGFVPQPSTAFPAAPGATAVPSQPAPSATTPRQAPYVELPPPPAGTVTSHIALLLPLDSLAFAKHAEAVKNGFFAATQIKGNTPLPVRVYATGDDPKQVTESYLRAVSAGARVIVGPLTRNGVTAIAESAIVMVPTLALNVPEGRIDPMPDLYTLSLQVEAEARQVAQLAWQEGRRNALTVMGDTPLLRRIHQAFVEEFTRIGGKHVAAYPYTTDPEGLQRIKLAADAAIEAEIADMAFLALDVSRARLSRGYLSTLPLYATSQVHPGTTGLLASYDLAGVRFLDMPWVLQPENPLVMTYPRPDYRDAVELERFHALGIDAFRIAQMLVTGRGSINLEGVTGRLTLGADRHFVRGLTSAQFRDGQLVVRERP
ncbi:MAG TPA: penicillin-binding protein activator [Burkholderiales bacterium]|nr:penicillin-binding protein activator [Burkholderiales bacterium]